MALGFVCQGVFTQQPDGVTWSNPPTARETETADEVKFVILAREPIDEEPCESWEFIASAWEVRPRGEKQITPRLRFEETGWSPSQLIRDPGCSRRDLVRLQVSDPGSTRGYSVNLYSINYVTWTVDTIWQGAQLSDAFWYGDEVYVNVRDRDSDQDQLMLLRNQLCELREPFQLLVPVRNTDNLNIVRIDHKNELPAIALYNASDHQLTSLSEELVHLFDTNRVVYVHADQSTQFIAMHFESDINLQGFNSLAIHMPQEMSSTVRILQLPSGTIHRIPIRLDVAPGSGIRYLYGDPIIGFDDKNRLLYWNGIDELVSRYDPNQGTTSQLTEQETEDYKRIPALEDSRYIPESIRYLLTNPYSDDHDVAHAFLEHKGIEYTRPVAWMDSTTGFSHDTERFLLKMTGVESRDAFFYGDLRNDLLLEIPCPLGLVNVNDMHIVPLH